MRYATALLFALALPLSAQTAQIDSLTAEVKRIEHELQKAKASHAAQAITLSDRLQDLGYAVEADTTDGDYVQVVLPDSLTRETKLILREADYGGIYFVKTSKASVIRIHASSVTEVTEALEAAFPAPTR